MTKTVSLYNRIAEFYIRVAKKKNPKINIQNEKWDVFVLSFSNRKKADQITVRLSDNSAGYFTDKSYMLSLAIHL